MLLVWLQPADDTVARIAGDLFAIILEKVNNPQDVANVAEKILSAFETSIKVDDKELHITTTNWHQPLS